MTEPLHHLVSSVAAPGLGLSSGDGQLRGAGPSGGYVGGVRLLDRLELSSEAATLTVVRSATLGADRQEFSYVALGVGDPISDPTVTVHRTRALSPYGLEERLVVESVAQAPVELTVQLRV